MTLAFVLLFSSFVWTAAARWPSQAQSAVQSPEPATQAAPDTTQENGNQQAGGAQPETKPSAQSPSNSTTPATTKRKRHKKKKAALSNCGVRPTPPVSTGTNPQGATPGDPSAGTASASPPGQNSAAPDPKDCPPPKRIVRHGGTSEPSIQLAGAPSDNQASHQRDVVNQLLGVTENNLKKVAGKQLNSTQQDTLSQARAFVQQSRSAIADGDLDRARTLAWKAETLSEDLTKP
jgi:hypothetical protein